VVFTRADEKKEVLLVQNTTALVLVDDATKDIEVIHPKQDGSYWNTFQFNRKMRLEEEAGEEAATRWLEQARVDRRRL
jgi:hypothetical protein